MSKKFNKKQLKKMNKSVSGGAVAKPSIKLAIKTSVYGTKAAAGTSDKTALQSTGKSAKKAPISIVKYK